MTLFDTLHAVDEWGHRHCSVAVHRIFFGILCDYVDSRLLGESIRSVRKHKPVWQWRDVFARRR